MASFSSSPSLPISDYVGAIDPQLYGQVIAQKQQQYDMGVQKVNAELSSIAGIQVIKDVHKQYLNNTVQGIQTDIQKLAGEDFSKQNVVNQALGLASKVAKDPIIQNAMMSTVRMQKAEEERARLQKDGKTSIENDWFYSKQREAWLNDGDVSSSFNASYNPYVNITKEFTDFYKTLNPNATLSQEDFILQGTNIALTRETAIKGISPNQVAQAWNIFTQRGDIRGQMNINAQYSYQGVPRNLMLAAIESDKRTIVNNTNTEIERLKSRLATDKTANPIEINQQISQLEERNSEIISNLDSLQGLDDDTLRRRTYEETLKHNMINTFSYSETSQKVIESPFEKAKRDQLDYELKVQQYQDKRLKDATKAASGGLPATQVVQRNTSEEEGKLGETTFKSALNNVKTQLADETKKHINSIAQFSGKKAPWKIGTDGEWIPNVGPMGYSSAQEAQAFNDSLYSQAKTDYENGKATHPVKAMFNDIDGLQRSAKAMETKAAEIDQSLDQFLSNLGVANISVPVTAIQSRIPKDVQDIKFGYAGNMATTEPFKGNITSKDLLNYYIASKGKGEAKTIAAQNISSNNNLTVDKVKNAIAANPQLKQLYNRISSVDVEEASNTVLGKEQLYKDAQSAYISYQENFIATKPEEYRDVEQRFRTVVGQIASGKQEDRGEYNDFIEAIEDGSKTRSNVYGYYFNRNENQAYLTLQKPDGEILEVPVSATQATNIPGIKIADEFTSKYGADLSLTQNTTTDITGTGANAYPVLGNPNNEYEVKYHLNGPGDNSFMLKLYIWDKQGNSIVSGMPYSMSASKMYMSQNEIIQAIKELGNDAVVKGIIQSSTSNNQ